ILLGGICGAGEAYMKGSWRCDEVNMLVRLFLRTRDLMSAFNGTLKLLRQPTRQLMQWLTRNTRSGSRRNIEAHYDIGNDLFALFLDPTMSYSCTWYPDASSTLEEAAVAKLDRVCRKLGLSPGMHLLEIGTGWGGLAIHAASRYGCRVTTTTISAEQYELARERIEAHGLSDRVDVLNLDYRDLEGQYDRIVSIEMIEAVGHQYMDHYFARCNSLLKPDGMMLIQAITMTDQYYEAALSEVDFITRYIFPGGFLPSVTAIASSLTRATQMRISHLEDIGLHYARTLQDWRKRFFEQIDTVRSLGYPESFIRLWDYYFCYCQGGFEERYLGTVQLLLTKADARPADVRY
ncbi:MAG: cyclopropane-fatty-acyl-phospholipid synthase family protein, partial [Sedimenticolaceae bacterium]|nr:cyclopropane-fatty-acyl-phospholipid synthase family protein [Sedimenticolaceae bacterium]